MTSQPNNKFREIITHVLIWVGLNGIIHYQHYLQFNTISNELLLRSFINIILFYFNFYYLVPKFVLKKKIRAYIALSLLLISITAFFASELVSHDFPDLPPGKDFPSEIRPPYDNQDKPPMNDRFRPKPNDLVLSPRNIPFISLVILLSFNFVVGAMLRIYMEWNKNEVLRKKVENEKVTSELQFLKTQLNPHFLFNSLNAIYSLSVKKSTDTSQAIINLSELMRYMLYEANQDLVQLEKEMNYIQNYVQLQRLRLSNSENVFFNISGNEKDKKVPPLLFISFIENAFKYGTDYKGKTSVKIMITLTEGQLNLTIKNIIGSYKKDRDSSGIGLQNVKNRLNLLYPNSHTLYITDTKKEYIVDLTLNLNEYEVYNN